MYKKMLLALSLALVVTIVAISENVGAADAAQDAYTAYSQTVAPLREQLAAKHAELAALHNSDQRDDAKATQLFKEIGDLKGQLYVAGEDHRAKMREVGAPEGGYGMHHRSGYGYGPEGGQFMDGNDYPMHRGYMGQGGHMRRGGHMGGGHGGHRGGWDW